MKRDFILFCQLREREKHEKLVGMTIRPVSHYSPEVETLRKGCPSRMTPTFVTPSGAEFTTMQLVHKIKEVVKNYLLLAPIHHQLELNASTIAKSGASNILIGALSFNCCITEHSGKKRWLYLTFDLKIPGISQKDALFLYETIEKAYGTKEDLYAALKYLYELGRGTVNPCSHKHGHTPSYNPESSSHDQYIRHTEQYLAAYLALPEAASMLANRLMAELRSQACEAKSVTVFTAGLHLHSTKTCCAPCEYCLLGLMNERDGFTVDELQLGFFSNFKAALGALGRERVKVALSEQIPFRLLVTVSVSEADAHHKKQPLYFVEEIEEGADVPPYVVNVKQVQASKSIYTVWLTSSFNLAQASNLTDKTVLISGSLATAGTRGTIAKVKSVREAEMKELEIMMKALNIK
jgi:hypothetical protein